MDHDLGFDDFVLDHFVADMDAAAADAADPWGDDTDLDDVYAHHDGPGADAPNGDNNQDSDDDEIEFLEEAPAHLRPVRHGSPINLVGSDDEDDEDEDVVRPPRPGKRRARDSVELLSSPPPKRQHLAPPRLPEQPIAGPSTEIIVTKVDHLLPLVLDVIPDLCTEWARSSLESIMETLRDKTMAPGQEAIDHVLNMAFEMERYPRGGDREKAAEEEEKQEKEKDDYKDPAFRSEARAGYGYDSRSLATLETLFTSIPVTYIRDALRTHGNNQLVPTYVYLHGLATMADKPYKELKKPRPVKAKWRADAMPPNDDDNDFGEAEFGREFGFLKILMSQAATKEREDMEAAATKEEQEAAKARRRDEAIALGRGHECGCCFDMEALEDMVGCMEGHLFCRQCVTSFAESKLGEQQTNITCMDTSGCQAVFSEVVLAEVVGERTMSLYHRLRQMKDLEMAAIDGLESCPHCPFALVIDNPDEKLFRCLNPSCLKVTCRKCKRADHIPRRCEEVEAAFKLDKRHTIEEAMSAALMRRCPKCAKAYLKESGCNKITCQNCRTVSCYICQKEIPEDYGHFDQFPGRRGKDTTKCHLWDRGNEGVAEAERIRIARDEARKQVLEAAAAGGVQLDDADINIEAPAAAPQRPGPYARFPAGLGGVNAHHRAMLAFMERAPEAQVAAMGVQARAAVDAERQNRAALAERLGAIRARHAREEAQVGHVRHLDNEILGFGRMIANHEDAMNAHQIAMVAHGRRLVNQMRDLAAPADPAPALLLPHDNVRQRYEQLMQFRERVAGLQLVQPVAGAAAPAAGNLPVQNRIEAIDRAMALAREMAAAQAGAAARVAQMEARVEEAQARAAEAEQDLARRRAALGQAAPAPIEAPAPGPAAQPRRGRMRVDELQPMDELAALRHPRRIDYLNALDMAYNHRDRLGGGHGGQCLDPVQDPGPQPAVPDAPRRRGGRPRVLRFALPDDDDDDEDYLNPIRRRAGRRGPGAAAPL